MGVDEIKERDIVVYDLLNIPVKVKKIENEDFLCQWIGLDGDVKERRFKSTELRKLTIGDIAYSLRNI